MSSDGQGVCTHGTTKASATTAPDQSAGRSLSPASAVSELPCGMTTTGTAATSGANLAGPMRSGNDTVGLVMQKAVFSVTSEWCLILQHIAIGV